MTSSRIKVMFLSDSPTTPTGFASISRSLAERLARNPDFEVFYIGHNYQGPEVCNISLDDPNMQQISIPYRLLPGGPAPYAAATLPHYLKRFQPDVLFVLLDTFMLMGAQGLPFGWFLEHDTQPAKFLMYFPSDGNEFPFRCENILKKSQYPVAMAKFGQRQIADRFGIKTDYIPHHVDTRLFRPASKEEKLQWRRQFGIPEDAFVFGSVARNQGRKMIGTTIEAFEKFMKKHPAANAYLWLHCDPTDPAAYIDLAALAHQRGIANNVIFSGMKFHQGFPIERMREVYGVMDVHVLTTSGEGFGIPTIEAAACGIPSMITDTTSTDELVDGGACGWKVPIGIEILGTWNVPRAFVQVDDIVCTHCNELVKSGFVRSMEEAYSNRGLTAQKGKLAREKAVREYDFDTVVLPKWIETLKKVVMS